MASQPTVSAPETPKTETFYKLLDKIPPGNVRNLFHITVAYAKAEANYSRNQPRLPDIWRQEIQCCADCYCRHMDENTRELDARVDELERGLESLDLRYYMGQKLEEFSIRRVHRESSVEFRKLPWFHLLKIMDEEKRQIVVFTRERDRKIQEPSITHEFKIAFQLAKKTTIFGNPREYEVVKQLPDVIRCHHDLLTMAKRYAERQLQIMPRFADLRKSGKWFELFGRIQDLEYRILEIDCPQTLLRDLLCELRQYKNLWFQKHVHRASGMDLGTCGLTQLAYITSSSTRVERIYADLDALVATCNREIADPEERMRFAEYADSVIFATVAEGEPDLVDESTAISTNDIPGLSRRSSSGEWVEIMNSAVHEGDRDVFQHCRIRGPCGY